MLFAFLQQCVFLLLCGQQFGTLGFYSVSLLCVRDAQLNACTFPITWTWDGSVEASKFLIVNKDGMRYTKEAKFCTIICITEGLLFDKEIAVINDDKVIYLKPNNISDMLCLYMILDEWKLAYFS